MANVNGTEINLKPTEGMKAGARQYKKWKAEGKKGGTAIAARRATQILSGSELSVDVVMRMFSFFSRHEVDKKAEGFRPGEKGYPSAGRVAWSAWGSDAGFSWSRKKSEQIKKARARIDDNLLNEYDVINAKEKSIDSTLEKPIEEKAAPNELKVGDYVSWNSSGGRARGQIEKITRNSTLNIPDSSFTVTGTKENPAALICIYRKAPNDSGFLKTDRIVGHRFSTLTKIDPLPKAEGYEGKGYGKGKDEEKSNNEELSQYRKLDLEELQQRNKGQSLVVTRELKGAIESDGNELYMSFSSEEPVQRYFGQEVLSHEQGAADLSRLNNGTAPFLWNHNRDEVLGVVQSAEISDDRRGYATVKWSKNPNAVEKRTDVEDGIISQVSFAYQINEIEERGDQMVVTKWKAMEVSLVSVPADASVGVGRSLENEDIINTTTSSAVAESPPVDDVTALEKSREALAAKSSEESQPLSPLTMEQKTDTEAQSKAVEAEQKRHQSIIIEERNRSNTITAMGEKYSCPDLAHKLNQEGSSVEVARQAINTYREDRLNNVENQAIQKGHEEVLNDQKDVRRFSFTRALHALANPADRNAQEAAAFEREVSDAAAKAYGKPAAGILVPNEVLARDLTVGTATAGGNLVSTDLLSGRFIDILRNVSSIMATNPTIMSGLQGNVSIPRQTGSSTAYWVGEGGSPTESNLAFDQVNMTPKTVGAFVDYSRRLLLQSSVDVEQKIRDDIAEVIALELDRSAIYGTGSSNQPLGVKDTTGIGSQALTSAGTFSEFIAMETAAAVANARVDNMFYLMNPTTRGALKSTEKATGTGQFVFGDDNRVNGYNTVVSNQLENNDVLFGDFSKFMIGFWSGLDLTVDPFAGATSGNVRVIALQDVDYAISQPGAFVFGT